MSSHAYARLGYGYDLGGDEGEYKILEDPDDLPWYDEGLGLETSAEQHLEKALGLPNVHFQTYGNRSEGYTGVLLFAGASLSRNWVAEIEIPEITDDHRAHLALALATLGINPEQGEPRWFLATHYG
jgi:hypothetical protein